MTMSPAPEFPIDLGLLGAQGVIRGTPTWDQVQAARQRLDRLRQTEQPYEEMESDRDAVLAYAEILQRSAQAIGCAVCLSDHLKRCLPAKTAADPLKDALRA